MAVESFNLDPPPGFRGLRADLPVEVYHRHLPHWRQRGATYFVTFRLADSIPQDKLRRLKRWRTIWERNNPGPGDASLWEQFAREITRRTEAWLDEGYGECSLGEPEHAREMANSLLYFQGVRCFTSCFIVMPNHVHWAVKPLAEHQLEDLLESVKRFVGRKINASRHRTGKLWQPESYDRIIRDEEHLYRVVQYIGRNAAKAGLPRDQWRRWIHPAWDAAGWGFRDDF